MKVNCEVTVNEYVDMEAAIERVGYNEKHHGYINPCQEIIEDKLSKYGDRDDSRLYKPVKFQPVDPSPNYDAWICNMKLNVDFNSKYMTTENNLESFDDETIVEFQYNFANNNNNTPVVSNRRKQEGLSYRWGYSYVELESY